MALRAISASCASTPRHLAVRPTGATRSPCGGARRSRTWRGSSTRISRSRSVRTGVGTHGIRGPARRVASIPWRTATWSSCMPDTGAWPIHRECGGDKLLGRDAGPPAVGLADDCDVLAGVLGSEIGPCDVTAIAGRSVMSTSSRWTPSNRRTPSYRARGGPRGLGAGADRLARSTTPRTIDSSRRRAQARSDGRVPRIPG